MLEYEMTPNERRRWWREIELTELMYRERQLKDRNFYFTPEYRKALEKRVADLKERYPNYSLNSHL